jgi:hypothetical protein
MAAGLGFKTFTTGEVLTAGDVNGYLMQGINVFANTTARNAAITAPAEGQFAFTKDTNSLWYYDGAAWVASGAAGDIEGVTVTSPLTGGGTSGTVNVGILSGTTSNLGAVQLSDSISSTSTTLAATANAVKTAYDNAIPKSLIDAAGDLIVGTGADTAGRLGIGSTGQVLTVSGGTPVWATAAGGGKVLQVVFASYSTETSSSSQTYADTGLTATITPSSASSRVMVIVNTNGATTDSVVNQAIKLKLVRASTDLAVITDLSNKMAGAATAVQGESIGFNWVDSPATTSATIYKTQYARLASSGTVNLQNQQNANGSTSTITLLEIGA